MSQLNFEPENLEPRPKVGKGKRLFWAGLTSFALLSIGTTFSARINLNNNGAVEYGQGVSQVTRCDSDGIEVTPINSFLNETNAGTFTFNAIQLKHISANCAGVDFIIKVFNQNGEALAITKDESQFFYQARVYFNPFSSDVLISNNDGSPNTVTDSGYWADQFTLVGSAPIVVGTLNNLFEIDPENPGQPNQPANQFFELDLNENAFQITFNPSTEIASGFTDSKNVYRITLESVAHQS